MRARHPLCARVALTIAVVAAGVAPTKSGAPAEADRLLAAISERHARAGTLVADFTQSFHSAALGQSVTESGRIWIKRPGLMRWEYQAPDRKVFLVQPDGTTLSYIPADGIATRGRLPDDAPHLDLLLGRRDLSESFAVAEVSLREPLVPTSRQLRLVPRRRMDGVEVVYLEVEPTSLDVLRVLVVDSAGNESDLVLTTVREGVRIRDKVFDAKLPRGVTVREASEVEP